MRRFSFAVGLMALGAALTLGACSTRDGGDYQERPYYEYLEYNDAGNAVAPEPETLRPSGPTDDDDPSVGAAKQSIPRE